MNSSDFFFKDPNHIFNLDETNIQLCVSTGKMRSIHETRNVHEISPGPCMSTLTFVGSFNANGSIVAPAIIYPDLRMPSESRANSSGVLY